MARPTALSPEQIERALRELPGWTLRDGALRRSLRFDDFVAAFAFMTAMALWSSALDHHPDWRNVYAQLEIALSTHDAGGITELDLQWARHAETVLAAARGGGA